MSERSGRVCPFGRSLAIVPHGHAEGLAEERLKVRGRLEAAVCGNIDAIARLEEEIHSYA